MFPRLPRLLKLCRIITHARLWQRLQHRESSARSRPPSVSTLRTHFCSALFAPVSSFVPWSVSPARHTVCDSTFGWSPLILPFRRKVRHRLRLCVQQERHVPLIHQSEVILELETELEPSLLIVVVLDRFRSKLQDFCDVCRRHVTAPLPCASFACSVTRSTTTEFQHNDIMMKTSVQNDLRLEMALESMWIVCS